MKITHLCVLNVAVYQRTQCKGKHFFFILQAFSDIFFQKHYIFDLNQEILFFNIF